MKDFGVGYRQADLIEHEHVQKNKKTLKNGKQSCVSNTDQHIHRRNGLTPVVRSCPNSTPRRQGSSNNHRRSQTSEFRNIKPKHIVISTFPGLDYLIPKLDQQRYGAGVEISR